MVLQLAWRGIEYLEHLESDGAASRSLLRLQSTERDHQLTRRSLPQKPEEDELTHHIIELASELPGSSLSSRLVQKRPVVTLGGYERHCFVSGSLTALMDGGAS
jgi:hypothetical protein